jgi:hypothetical protein
VKLSHEVAVLSSESSFLRKKIDELSQLSHQETMSASSSGVFSFRLHVSVPAPFAASNFFSLLQEKTIFNSAGISAAIFNLLPISMPPNNLAQTPKLEQSLHALNAMLQLHSSGDHSNLTVLECCSFAQSCGKVSIDENWLAVMILSVCSLCAQHNVICSSYDDFVLSLCRDLASYAGRGDHRSIIIICTISVVASFLCMPTLLNECFCIAFNASSTLNVIPSLLFHSARIWPVPYFRSASSCPLLSLFIACMFDPCTQASMSDCEAAHAVAFLHLVSCSRFSSSSVALVVPMCVASMSGTDVYEAYVACKFAVSILDTSSIWSSIAHPIFSMLNRHFDSSSDAHFDQSDSTISRLHVCSNDATGDPQLANKNVVFCINLLGHSISEILQQSELFLSDTLSRISPAVNFLFSICCRDKETFLQLNDSPKPTVSLSPSEAAFLSLKEMILVSCKVLQMCYVPSDFHSIDSMETLWARTLSPSKVVENSFALCKRPCISNCT